MKTLIIINTKIKEDKLQLKVLLDTNKNIDKNQLHLNSNRSMKVINKSK
jgi:hypothetical protein